MSRPNPPKRVRVSSPDPEVDDTPPQSPNTGQSNAASADAHNPRAPANANNHRRPGNAETVDPRRPSTETRPTQQAPRYAQSAGPPMNSPYHTGRPQSGSNSWQPVAPQREMTPPTPPPAYTPMPGLAHGGFRPPSQGAPNPPPGFPGYVRDPRDGMRQGRPDQQAFPPRQPMQPPGHPFQAAQPSQQPQPRLPDQCPPPSQPQIAAPDPSDTNTNCSNMTNSRDNVNSSRLTNCTDCVNCSNLVNCRDCVNCSGCRDSRDLVECSNCVNCHDCVNCSNRTGRSGLVGKSGLNGVHE